MQRFIILLTGKYVRLIFRLGGYSTRMIDHMLLVGRQRVFGRRKKLIISRNKKNYN
jgi:hypothetical protein